METKVCRACGKTKELKDFAKSYGMTLSGYMGRCKKCIATGNLIPKDRFGKKETNENKEYYQLTGVGLEEYMLMYEILGKIGYNVNDKNKSVHEQFCEKYNLRTKRKTLRTENLYLPDGSINPRHYTQK